MLSDNKMGSNTRQLARTNSFYASRVHGWRHFFIALILLLPGTAFSMQGYLGDMTDTFVDISHMDTCGDCHSDWSGGRARGDLGVAYKLWDWDSGGGMSRALRKIDVFGIGMSNEWKILNELSGDRLNAVGGNQYLIDEPYSYTGASDKDGDGYINLIYRTERAGMPINNTSMCSTCTAKQSGGNKGAMPAPPFGWDVDDNDATIVNLPGDPRDGLPRGAVPWDWNTVAANISDPTPGTDNSDAPLSEYWSEDVIAPNQIMDFAIDVSAWGANNTNAIPLTWTAPADDDPDEPLASPVDKFKSVHHYDMRYTTETVLNTYNTDFLNVVPMPKLCGPTAEANGNDACLIRSRAHWHSMWHLSDCGINNGSGQEHLMHTGVMLASNANSCGTAGVSGWNRGIATPLMRALYESGFEDVEPGGGELFETCPPCGPQAPGSTETYVLTEVTNKHLDQEQLPPQPYPVTSAFLFTDQHDAATNVAPNYIADGTVYWMAMASDDSVVQPWVELLDNNPPDGVVYGGPFKESVDGSGNGFAGYEDPGYSEISNIVAVKAGPFGVAISNVRNSTYLIPPLLVDSSLDATTITLDGVGFSVTDPADGLNVISVDLVDIDGVSVANVTVGTGLAITNDNLISASFTGLTASIGGAGGTFTIETRNTAGETTAAWVDAVTFTSTQPGTIALASATATISEGIGSWDAVVTRNGGTLGALQVTLSTTSVGVTTEPGVSELAVPGDDYTEITGTTVSWVDGDATPQTVPITITDDTISELDQLFKVVLSNPSSSAYPAFTEVELFVPPTETVVTITDNELKPGGLRFVVDPIYVDETAGTAIVQVDRYSDPNAAPGTYNGIVSVNIATDDSGTARALDNDFTANSGVLIWGDGVGGVQSFTVTLTDDLLLEPTEYFVVLIDGSATEADGITPLPGLIDPISSVYVYINDDDTPPTFSFSAANYDVTEGATTVPVIVERSGRTEEAATVTFSTVDNTATDTGVGLGDYDDQSQVLNFAIGETSKQIDIPINADDDDEQNEIINLTLTSPVDPAVVDLLKDTATITINDDDSTVVFSAPTYSVDETGASVTVTVTRSDITVPPTYPGNVSATLIDDIGGSATAAVDYLAVNQVFNWVDGDSGNLSQTVNITINDDADLEGDETVNLKLTPTGDAGSGAGLLLGTPGSSVLTIIDNEKPGVLSFSLSGYTVNEDGTGTIDITVVRTGGSSSQVTVDYATADGTAENVGATLGDYDSAIGTLTWVDGDVAPKIFSITINSDLLVEPTETVALTLSSPSGDGAVQPTLGISSASLNIIDSVGRLEYINTPYSIQEGTSATTVDQLVTVRRVEGSGGALTGTYTTVDASATIADTDYAAASGSLNWASGEANTDKTFIVTVNGDRFIESDETISLQTSWPDVNAVTQTAITLLTILNDDSPGVLQFSASNFVVDEANANVTATITVSRVNGDVDPVEVTYSTADGIGALAGVDYLSTTATLNWPDGDTADRTFPVTIVGDTDWDAGETVLLSLSAPVNTLNPGSPPGLGNPSNATLTIVDDDHPGYIRMTNTDFIVNEDGGVNAQVLVERISGSGGYVSIDYATADGTALTTEPDNTNGFRDYEPVSNTLQWAPGETSAKIISIPILNDVIDENDETLTVTLSNPMYHVDNPLSLVADPARLTTPSISTLTIIDSMGVIQIDSASYVINEPSTGKVNVDVTVSRVGGTNGSVAVNYTTADGTATTGQDYTSRAGTLTWADGNASTQNITIPVDADLFSEGDETLTLSLSDLTITMPDFTVMTPAMTGAWLGTALTTVTIKDAPGTVQFSLANFEVNEDSPGIVNLIVTRTGGKGGAASVVLNTDDGTALAIDSVANDGDYDGVTSLLLSWADGDDVAKIVPVVINNDLLPEGSETVLLNLSAASGVALGAQSDSTLTILDSPGLIQFSAANYSESEDGIGYATITLTRTEGGGGAAQVNYASLDSDLATTATVADYDTVGGTITWADGDWADKTFTIGIVQDVIIEDPDEQVKLGLSAAIGATMGSPTTALLSIVDSAGTIQFSAPSYSVAENVAGGTVTITVNRVGGNNGAASVDYAITNGTAFVNSDYTVAATTGTLSWLDGNNDPKTIMITIINDTGVETSTPETVNLSLNTALGVAMGTPNTTVLSIVDDDVAGNLEFTSANYYVNEDSALGYIDVTVRRVLGSVGTVRVDYIVSGGTAVAGVDYTSTPGSIEWLDGDVTDKTFRVMVLPDAIIEAGGEFMNLTLSNPTGLATLNEGATTQQTALLRIIDSAGSLRIASSTYTVNEQSGQLVVSVERINGSGGAIQVSYATSDGTAVAGADYSTKNGTLSWAADNYSAKTISLDIINDTLIESDETFNLTLSAPTGGATLDAQNSAVLTIVSEDAPGSVQLSASSYQLDENDVSGYVRIYLKRVGGSVGAAAVYIQTAPDAGGTNPATTGDDYTAVAATRIDWDDGDASDKWIDVAISDDANYEPDETFLIILSNPVGVVISGVTTAPVTILNDDAVIPVTITIDPGWSMISFPTALDVNADITVLTYDDIGKVPVVWKRVSSGIAGSFAGTYAVADTATPGEGYYFLNDRTVSITLDDQKNNAQTLDPFEITLQVGGNMIGNPYHEPIDMLTDVRVCNFTLTGCALISDWSSWTTAATNGWVTGTIYRYDTATSAYLLKNPADPTMIMAPWEGYWVRTETANVLKMRFYNQVVAP